MDTAPPLQMQRLRREEITAEPPPAEGEDRPAGKPGTAARLTEQRPKHTYPDQDGQAILRAAAIPLPAPVRSRDGAFRSRSSTVPAAFRPAPGPFARPPADVPWQQPVAGGSCSTRPTPRLDPPKAWSSWRCANSFSTKDLCACIHDAPSPAGRVGGVLNPCRGKICALAANYTAKARRVGGVLNPCRCLTCGAHRQTAKQIVCTGWTPSCKPDVPPSENRLPPGDNAHAGGLCMERPGGRMQTVGVRASALWAIVPRRADPM